MKRLALLLSGLAALALLAAAAVIYGGLYDVSALRQHWAPTYSALDYAMRRGVQVRATDLPVPRLDDPALVERGLSIFAAHCVQCHGAPGVAPEPFALGLTPSAANLAHTAREWTPQEVFWVVKNGLKMTGMPAWEFRLPEPDLWAVVAFVYRLPELSPENYRQLAARRKPYQPASQPLLPADPERGKTAILQYACLTCHRIPGVVGPQLQVGPPLEGMARRAVIAGILPNEAGNMERWLMHPQAVNPRSAMPDLGVTEQDARDMAAYLATLR